MALLLLGRLLGESNRHEVAREACQVALERAIDLENLPLAVTAAREAARFGTDASPLFDSIARAFCHDSPRFGEGAAPPVPLPSADAFQPLASVLTGALLNNKAAEIVHDCKSKLDAAKRPGISALPLFSALDEASLRRIVEAMDPVWVLPDTKIIEQGTVGEDAYWVARGELEARRQRRDEVIPLARLRPGALFGEMALLSRAPRAGSVVSTRPSVVVRISKKALDALAIDHPAIATELGIHCRDSMVSNLMRTSDLLKVVPEADLPALIAKFRIVAFEKNDRLLEQNELPSGIFLIASGEVAVVRRDDEGTADPLIMGTLAPGDVAGDVATVLRRKANVAFVATHPTVTLFLPATELVSLTEEHPAILARLYLLAIKNDDEERVIMNEEASAAEDFDLI